MNGMALAFRLARRELRSGLSGFRIFFASLVLGVVAIASVGSLSEAFLTGMAQQGRVLLGGDISVGLVHREATPQEHAFLAHYGRVSENISMRAMAYAQTAKEDRELIELKAVDGLYPLYGSMGLTPAISVQNALACSQGICGAVAEQTLLDRLHLSRGGIMRIGDAKFRVSAVLDSEPDRISGGFSLGPHVMISPEGLKRTGLVTLGSLIEYSYRVATRGAFDVVVFKQAALKAFPDAGWEIHDRSDAAPGTKSLIEELTMFLTLVGLTVLAVGGVGAGQAISAFLDRKRGEIAILKSLGADGRLIFFTFFMQIMAIAALAVIVGLVIGAAVPFAIGWFYAARLPMPAIFALYPGPLVLAAAFGLLSATIFGIPPLARAREIAPANLFRDLVAPSSARGRLPYLIAAALAGLLVIALTLVLAPSPVFATEFIAGIIAGLIALRVIAECLRFIARHVPRPRSPGLRLALANMTRPGASMTGVVTALGLGLTLLTTVTLLDRTISAQVENELPDSAPSFYFIDIQPAQTQRFDAIVSHYASVQDYRRTPMIRGRIAALNGVPARDVKIAQSARWVLSGDRGITYAATPPKNTEMMEGQWWPANYKGPTLISFDGDLAKDMNLKLGDTITVNVLGRDITGRIANFRHVDFSNGRQNFVLILSPGVIDKAPHAFLASVHVAARDEESLYRAVTDAFPNISVVRVREAIAQVSALLEQLRLGTRAASLLTIFAGLLVLAGAIAAGGRARLYDATVLKVLGATRGRIALITALEYGALGLVTGGLALGSGSLAASLISEHVFHEPMTFDLGAALLTILGGAAATLTFGLAGAWTALAAKPAALLRNP
jgi:putative ABC transport system permease protein